MSGTISGSNHNNNNNNNSNIETNSEEHAPKPHYLDVENLNDIPLWLAPCHLVAALFQCMQALFLFAFASRTELHWLIFTNFPTTNTELLDDNIYAMPEPKQVGSYAITWYAGVFILFSGMDHIMCILPHFRQNYEWNIQRHQSPQRWIEYSFASPLMKTYISQVAGITDIHLLFLIYICHHVTCYFAIVHERMNARARADGYRQDWLFFNLGFVPHMAAWVVTLCYFFEWVARTNPPGFVSTIVIVLFLLDLSFPIVFVLQWMKIGKFQDYLVGEFALIMCSFTAKTFLAWITLAGANRFSRNN